MAEVIGLAIVIFLLSFFAFWVGISIRIARGAKDRRAALADPRTRALSILNERYALGEISRDEYLEKKAFIE